MLLLGLFVSIIAFFFLSYCSFTLSTALVDRGHLSKRIYPLGIIIAALIALNLGYFVGTIDIVLKPELFDTINKLVYASGQ